MTSVMLPNLRRQPEDDDGGTPPMQPPALPPEVHDATQDHAAKRALNTASMISLDPQQPDYQDKLANHVAHGELLNAAHENTVNKMQMPVYGGPSKEPVPQGQPIPAAEMPQDVHKFQVSDLKNKIAEAERRGDHAAAGQARMALASEIRMNPLGSEANHPGVMGKIGHVLGTIGNVVGNATIGPQNMSLIPGSQANLAARQAGGMAEEKAAGEEAQKAALTGEAEARTGATKAQQAHTEEETRQLQNKPEPQENLQQEYTDAVMNAQAHPDDPVAQQKVEQLRDAITSIQKPTAVKAPHVTYDSGVPVSVTDADGNVYDVNDPKLPAALKPLAAAAQRAHGQHVQEDAAKQAAAFGQQQKMFNERQNALTNATKTMLEAAPRVEGFIQRIRPLVDELEKSGDLGPGAGRWSEFWAGKVGADKPEFVKLRTDVGLLSTLLMRMHVGARGGEYIMQHFSDMINAGKQSPDNMRAALGEIEEYARQLEAERGGGAKVGGSENATPPATGPTKPVAGAMPSFAEWKQKQQQGAAGAR